MHRQPPSPPPPQQKTTEEYSSDTAGPNVRATALVLETDGHSSRSTTNRSIHFSATTDRSDTAVGSGSGTTQISLPTSELPPAGSSADAKPSEHKTSRFMTNLSIHSSDTTAVTDTAVCSTSVVSLCVLYPYVSYKQLWRAIA